MGFTAADVPDQSGRTILVTGANTGLGLEISHVLAAKGARVLLGCRDKGRAEAAMLNIRQKVPAADLAFVPLDQADIGSIRRAVELVNSEPRLDVLINNAGLMMPPPALTKDGFEIQFAVNHLGPFVLTSLLLPKLENSPEPRIVITASLAHKQKYFDLTNIGEPAGPKRGHYYGRSKLANLLFLLELDCRLRAAGSSIIATGCHPGVATTDLMRNFAPLRILNPLLGRIFNTAAMGAWPALHAATGPVVPGGYYGPTGFAETRGEAGEVSRSDLARDAKLSRELWDASIRLTGVDPGLPPAQC